MLVYIRGAGAVASGIAVRLFHANCKIIMSDRKHPRALRRNVCFSEALRNGSTVVEGIEAVAASDPERAVRILRENKIAVINDPDGDLRGTLPFDACIDAVLDGDPDATMRDAPIVIGVGKGFRPGENCHAAVVAFQKGHQGRVRYAGDGLPESIAAEEQTDWKTSVFVNAPREGLFYPVCEIGDPVRRGDAVAVVDNDPVIAPADGLLCGILPEGRKVTPGLPCAEILSGEKKTDLRFVAEEALAVGGGVLEALLHFREVY